MGAFARRAAVCRHPGLPRTCDPDGGGRLIWLLGDHLDSIGPVRTRIVALALLGVLVASGCASRPAPRPVVAAAKEPSALLAAVQAREDSVQTLRVRFSSTARYADQEHVADGVLLVKKPDRFRLRLYTPFGFTVLDYTSVHGEVHLELPLQGQRLTDGNLPQDGPLAPLTLREAFLRAEAAFPGTCEAQNADREVFVSCRDGAGSLLRTMRIERKAGLVSEEIDFKDGEVQAVTHFGDYRRVGAIDLPFTIDVTYPQRDVQMGIKVRNYEVNPAIADELFDVVD